MSCLVIKNDGIGDIVLFSGLLTSIASEFDGNVDLVTRKENAEIANLISGVRNVFFAERDQVSEETQALLRKQSKYDYAIVPRRFIRKSVFSVMQNISAEKKFCCWQYPTNLTMEKAETGSKGWKRIQGTHSSISELNYLQGFCQTVLGCELDPTPRLNLDDSNDHKQPNPSKKRIGICLGGASSRWPYLHWLELLDGLVSKGLTPVLFGTKTEFMVAEKLVSKINPVESYVGKLSLIETITAFRQLHCVVSNDTGLAHLATLCTPKVVTILGGGTFGRFFPWPKQENQYIVHYGMDCYDCEWRCCHPEKLCLDFIEPSDVLDYLLRILADEKVTRTLNLSQVPKTYPVAWRLREGACPERSTTQIKDEELVNDMTFKENVAKLGGNEPTRMIIFGTGPTAKIIADQANDQIELVCSIDNDPARRERPFLGKPVHAPEEILGMDFDEVALASGHSIEMYHQLRKLGIEPDKINFPCQEFIS
jgi:ADP-heptose:LPS heptosyltransferase